MALRLSKLISRSTRNLKQKQLVAEDDEDDDNVSLCSDMDGSKHNLVHMMSTFNPADIINRQINASFQPYHTGGDDADDDVSQDSDISDDDNSFGDHDAMTPDAHALNDGKASVISCDSDSHKDSREDEIIIKKPAQFTAQSENEVVGTRWVQNSDAARHLQLEILPRSQHSSSHQRHHAKTTSRTSKRGGNKHATKPEEGDPCPPVKRAGSSSLRQERSVDNSVNTPPSAEKALTRVQRNSVRRSRSNDETLAGMRDAAALTVNVKSMLSDSIHNGQNQLQRLRTKSSHCRLGDSSPSLDCSP
jgi:hypothetical protein